MPRKKVTPAPAPAPALAFIVSIYETRIVKDGEDTTELIAQVSDEKGLQSMAGAIAHKLFNLAFLPRISKTKRVFTLMCGEEIIATFGDGVPPIKFKEDILKIIGVTEFSIKDFRIPYAKFKEKDVFSGYAATLRYIIAPWASDEARKAAYATTANALTGKKVEGRSELTSFNRQSAIIIETSARLVQLNTQVADEENTPEWVTALRLTEEKARQKALAEKREMRKLLK